jgi:predicted DNA-binding transcriptional regulator YafY
VPSSEGVLRYEVAVRVSRISATKRRRVAREWDEFEHGAARDAGEAAESVARKIWLLLELLRYHSVRLSQYVKLHGRNRRSFQRDLQQLRTIGNTAGFTISKIDTDGVARLEHYDTSLRRLDDARPPLLRLLAELAKTLGEPIRGEIGAIAETAPEGELFLHVQAPTLAEGSHVARVYARLKDAWSSPAGRASVRIRYRTSSAVMVEERTVDPYRVVVRSGRYYLIPYDHGRCGWRVFALDAIVGLPVKAGTIPAGRVIPEEYVSGDVLGFIKGRGKPVEVTVELSAAVAASATSRLWKHDQVVEKLAGGKARITVSVSDPAEVVRWAFGFGADARVVAPEAAVRMARELAERLVAAHEAPSV